MGLRYNDERDPGIYTYTRKDLKYIHQVKVQRSKVLIAQAFSIEEASSMLLTLVNGHYRRFNHEQQHLSIRENKS